MNAFNSSSLGRCISLVSFSKVSARVHEVDFQDSRLSYPVLNQSNHQRICSQFDDKLELGPAWIGRELF